MNANETVTSQAQPAGKTLPFQAEVQDRKSVV